MADLLDPASLPKGTAIESGHTVDGREALRLSFKGRAADGTELCCHVVIPRREALAFGLQVSHAARKLSPEDRG